MREKNQINTTCGKRVNSRFSKLLCSITGILYENIIMISRVIIIIMVISLWLQAEIYPEKGNNLS